MADKASLSREPALTPEMLEAGIKATVEWRDGSVERTKFELVRDIYTAMRSKAQKCDCQDGE